MKDSALPELPEQLTQVVATFERALQEYGRACVMAERERCARVCDHLSGVYATQFDEAGECAAAIRKG